MSSPLSWFRKNERLLLGIFGVALIIVFTISLGTGSDPLIDWLSGGGRRGARENNVVVTWKNGNLRESDFEVMRQQRQRVLPLTQTIAQEAYVKGATELSASQIPPTIDEDHLMETRLLATEAERMGIVVSDDAVADYLYRLGAGKLSNNDLQEIMLRVTEGRMTQDQLMKILRYELSAMMVRAMAQSGTFPASPDSLWDFFNRLERRVRAELLPYPAEQFLAEVGEPKDADVRDLYEQHKDDLSNPATGDIGFKRRKKVAFQYFKVSYAPFLATAKAEISDEEVAKYYEEHKDDFRTTTPATTGTDNVSDQTSAPPSDTDIVPADTNLNQPEMTDLDTESPETTEPETTEPETTEPETTEPETTEPETTEPETTEPETTEPETTEPEAAEREATESEGADVADGTSGEQQLADDPEDEGEKVNSVEPSQVETESETTSPDQSAAEGDATEASGVTDTDLTPRDESSTTTGEATDLATPVSYKPLEEVADEIRTQLASPIAQGRLDATISELRKAVKDYEGERIYWEMQDEAERGDAPDVPDFKAIAETKKAEFGSLPPLDLLEVQKEELGRSFDVQYTESNINIIHFVQQAYEDNIPVYEPKRISSREDRDTQFIYWRTEEQAEYVPTLEQCRDDVVHAWKMQEALKLARKMAEEEAAKGEAEKPLALTCKILPDQIVTETNPVSWMTGGSIPLGDMARPFLSSIPGVPAAGRKFMRQLFRLEKGQIGVVENDADTIVYVARIVEETPSIADRRQMFASTGVTAPLVDIGRTENLTALSDWYQRLSDQYSVEWKRQPHVDSRRAAN